MTTITKVGGVMVVTQVIPQSESSIPLQTPATAIQTPPPVTKTPPQVTKASPTASTKLDGMTATFLQGEPQGLGVVQIFIGMLCILFSVTAAYSPILLVHAPLCLAVTFVVSGSLTLAAVRRTSVRLVWVSLVWNMISVVLALVGVAYVSWLLADRPPSLRFCETETFTDHELFQCLDNLWLLNVSVNGPLGVLLVLLVLQVCVAITACVFSAKAIRRNNLYTPITVDVDDCSAVLVGAVSAYDSDVGLLDSDGQETPTSPPNSP